MARSSIWPWLWIWLGAWFVGLGLYGNSVKPSFYFCPLCPFCPGNFLGQFDIFYRRKCWILKKNELFKIDSTEVLRVNILVKTWLPKTLAGVKREYCVAVGFLPKTTGEQKAGNLNIKAC